ncbi:MAG: exosortase U, partial [Planctomycetaceae bacterium]
GIVLFVVSLALVLSTDQLLRFLIPGGKVRVGDYFRKNANYYYGGDEYFKNPSAESVADSASPKAATYAGSWFTTVCLSAPLPLIGLFQLSHFPSAILPTFVQADVTFEEFGAAALPQSLGGFERVDYTTIQRVEGDPMGRDSQQWTYRRGPVTLRVSVDYPYTEVHDMCVCYDAVGWLLDEKRLLGESTSSSQFVATDGPVGLGIMHRPLYGHGLVYFSQVDQGGRLHAALRELAIGDAEERGTRRLDAAWNGPRKTTPEQHAGGHLLPYVQFHMLVQGDHPFDANQQAELLKLYEEFRRRLRPLVSTVAGLQSKPGNMVTPLEVAL